MVTLCWATKGGSGTTVVAAAFALRPKRPALLVDLDGDLPIVLGLAEPERPGVDDWLRTDAPPEQLTELIVRVDDTTSLLPHRSARDAAPSRAGTVGEARWSGLGGWLAEQEQHGTEVFVDVGTAPPPPHLLPFADQVLLVTRPCYLSLQRAQNCPVRPTGVVLVNEPGRSLRVRDIETAIGAPVVATLEVDPAIARAVDSGLLSARLPWGLAHNLRRIAS